MNEKKRYPDWFLSLIEKGPLAWVAVVGAPIILLMLVAVYLDSRLEDIEDKIEHTPPTTETRVGVDVLPEQVTTGQTIYVPVYSHVYHLGGRRFQLETTLSVRNTDPIHPITVTSVRYYDTAGSLVKHYLKGPLRIAPLATAEFLVEQKNTSGGSGANFIVEWVAENEVNEPIVEAVMAGSVGSQGMSFARPGRPISHAVPKSEK
jgi:hypothetical protein